MQHGIISIG
jgi:F-type H+-transporting ATPase subunit gamma